ncbi:chitinase-like protein PB1E7.04c [Haliotis rufescens]|uniref:chitinase-like protein PB1E7.04c n=1 Tax=Haliotis rufescens TaxID=6454 RepID=UPI00201EB504|nr:chitinase-like protein PB1E7.04c [Haliotis rufescens]
MLLLLACLCVVGHNAHRYSSSGKEFLVTFPENVLNHSSPRPQCIIITTILNTTSVRVTSLSQKINYTNTVNITSAEGGYICLEQGIQLSGSGITDRVVHVISDNDVNVLAADFGINSIDIYLALPVDQFGFSFYVVTYQSLGDKTQFSVIASSANTEVIIEFPPGLTTLRYNNITIRNPTIINVTLQKHEVIQFQNDKDLTGVYVSSNEPIAVIAGARKSKLDTDKTADHLVEQMTPVTTWGKHFISILSPGKDNKAEDLYRILASTPNTTVHVGGSTYSLEKEGDWFETRISATVPAEIKSNEAILVVKFVTFTKNRDPCMTIVGPNIQWQYQYSFSFPDSVKHVPGGRLIIVIDSSFKSSLMLNSQSLDIQNWVDVKDTNLISGSIFLPKKYYVIQSASSSFAAYIYQKNKTCGAFCSAAGMDLTPINENWIHSRENVTDCSTSPMSTTAPSAATKTTITTSASPSTTATASSATTTMTTPSPITTSASPSTTATASSATTTMTTPSPMTTSASPSTTATASSATTTMTTPSPMTTSASPSTTATASSATTTMTTPSPITTSASTSTTATASTPTTTMTTPNPMTTTTSATSLSTKAETTPTIDTTQPASGTDSSTVGGNENPANNCSQGAYQGIHQNITQQELEILVKHLQAHLRILPNGTSKAIRRKISAPDDRPSSKTFGVTGCTCLSLCFVVLLLADIPRIIRHLRGCI